MHWSPHPGPQTAFLIYEGREALYGGAAGGGKSVALLMAALQWVDHPGYRALILRRTYQQLVKPDALIPLSHEALAQTDAEWNGTKRQWTFPSGAVLEFGYLARDEDKHNYQGAAYDFVGFDELTHFPDEGMYSYLFSRVRKRAGSPVPDRVRATANPGGAGHEWVKGRFIDNVAPPHRVYFPATLEDNPSLDMASYEANLALLSDVERRRLRHGDWDVVADGPLWGAEHFPTYGAVPIDFAREALRDHGKVFVCVDCKGKVTTSVKVRKGESYVSAVAFLKHGGRLYVLDEEHGAWGLTDTLRSLYRLHYRLPISAWYIEDKALGPEVMKRIRAGWHDKERGRRHPALSGVVAHSPRGSKEQRAEQIQPNIHAGDVHVPDRYRYPWVQDWLSEIARTPAPPNDRGDTLVMGVEVGIFGKIGGTRVTATTGRTTHKAAWG